MRRPPSDLRLALLVLEGYAWLLGVVAAFGAVLAFLAWGLLARRPLVAVVALFVGVPTALLAWASVRVFFFRLPEPRGVALARDDAPALHALADDVARALGVPRAERLVVSPSFNASLAHRRTLVVGLPVLAALSVDELRSVVAHELAHLGHHHGRLAAWVYRTRRTWLRLMAAVHERGAMPIFVRWPFAHYVPRLDALSAHTARAQELLADRVAASLVGARTTADTLVLMDLGGRIVGDRFWPAVHDAVETDPEPPHPFARMTAEGARPAPGGDTEALLRELLEEETEDDDSHPCLTERLRAVGEPARLPPAVPATAGEALLGAAFAELAARLDAEWRDAQREAWTARHGRLRDAHARLATLEADSAPGADALFARAELLATLRGSDAARPFYLAALEADPAHARAAFALGELLLEDGDDAGAALLERAAEGPPNVAEEACELLADLYEERGQESAAARWRTRGDQARGLARARARERDAVSALDRFVPHEVEGPALDAVRAAVASEPDVREAFLAARLLFHSEGRPLVLAVGASGSSGDVLCDRVRRAVALPAGAAVVVLGREPRALRDALAAVPGAALL
ncbi:M48 family metalloprotease [Roseisolibacter sp. H3M3-2]|uniref:M48 family metalloprotease n=1 Tax=Roseisolibacter sp. H3M3-2 TaxID=3031323 RepID=UPI0023D9A00A|nr:M48 family metalloprotease [Roseisolibacter sp. H3M3-2]MDF1504519.1 M48 family metalloprotease [Roseisolibacter sp. H3M3-2]